MALLMLACGTCALAEGIDDWASETPTLCLWDEGELVERLQYELAACGFYKGEVNGLFYIFNSRLLIATCCVFTCFVLARHVADAHCNSYHQK